MVLFLDSAGLSSYLANGNNSTSQDAPSARKYNPNFFDDYRQCCTRCPMKTRSEGRSRLGEGMPLSVTPALKNLLKLGTDRNIRRGEYQLRSRTNQLDQGSHCSDRGCDATQHFAVPVDRFLPRSTMPTHHHASPPPTHLSPPECYFYGVSQALG